MEPNQTEPIFCLCKNLFYRMAFWMWTMMKRMGRACRYWIRILVCQGGDILKWKSESSNLLRSCSPSAVYRAPKTDKKKAQSKNVYYILSILTAHGIGVKLNFCRWIYNHPCAIMKKNAPTKCSENRNIKEPAYIGCIMCRLQLRAFPLLSLSLSAYLAVSAFCENLSQITG